MDEANAQQADGYRRNRLGDTRALLMNTGLDTNNFYRQSSARHVGAIRLAMRPSRQTYRHREQARSHRCFVSTGWHRGQAVMFDQLT